MKNKVLITKSVLMLNNIDLSNYYSLLNEQNIYTKCK
jgi:hypothetical protein